MSVLKNRGVALLLTLFMVVFAVFFGAWRSLNRERALVEALRTEGSVNIIALDQLIESRKNDSKWMITYASPILTPDDEFLLRFSEEREKLLKAETFLEICELNGPMDQTAFRLRGRAAAVLKGGEKLEFDKTYEHFTALSGPIETHVYFAQAEEFNLLLSKFPAILLQDFAVIKPLPCLRDRL